MAEPMMRRASDRIDVDSLPTDPRLLPSRPKPLGIAGKSLAREAAREAMARTNTSQKAFAINAEITEQRLSDALKQDGPRNLELGWVLAQDVELVAVFMDIVSRRLSLQPRSRRALTTTEVSAIVARLIEEIAS